MKKRVLAVLFGTMMLGLAMSAVGSAEAETEDPSWHQDFRTDITRTGSTERETPDANNQVHSYLSGELKDADIVLSRPMAVMINNISDAMPQSGLSYADVIYEAPVEGDITRLMALFDDYSGLSKIGPIRSCRDYFVDFALEFDAIYTHFGQAVYAYDLLNSDMVNNISGLQYQDQVGELNGYAGEDIFYRTDDRPAPHNAYTSEDGLNLAIERLGYSRVLDDDYTGHFKFAADGETVTYTDGTATYIQPSLYSNKPHFEYSEESGKYLRYQYGDAHIDEMTYEQLSVDNVIIQYCPVVYYDDNGYLNVNTNAGGDAILFTRGTFQRATWEKASDWGPARYYDANGEEISLNQGTTWVCIVSHNRTEDTMFE
ncbi:MAG: DUF3048 domain-containing protein [Eubacteriales bacterium]|nr:DUF3048 domain-containing protein [Eubacteriales bacterium]